MWHIAHSREWALLYIVASPGYIAASEGLPKDHRVTLKQQLVRRLRPPEGRPRRTLPGTAQ